MAEQRAKRPKRRIGNVGQAYLDAVEAKRQKQRAEAVKAARLMAGGSK